VIEIPKISGQVVDSADGTPVRGARIVARSALPNGRTSTVTSNGNGAFAIDAVTHTEWVPLGADALGDVARIDVEAAGYQPTGLKQLSSSSSVIIRLIRNEDKR
jgi:hypothetical protein